MSLFIRILLGSLFVLGISACAPAGDSASEEAPAEEMPMEEMAPAEPAEEMAAEEMTEAMPAEGEDGGDMAEEAPAEDAAMDEAEAVEMTELEEAAE